MEQAFKGLVTVCETMFFVDLEQEGDVVAFNPNGMAYGGCISLIRGDGSWDMALFGDEKGCVGLAKAVYAMEDDEEPTSEEVVDALGELVNMVSGSLKKDVGSAGQKSEASIPLFLQGDDCKKYATREIELKGLRIKSDGFDGNLYFVWSERNSRALIREISSVLKNSESGDALGLVQVLSLFQELSESLPETTDDTIHDTVSDCEVLVAEVINNGQSDAGDKTLASIVSTVDSLLHALGSAQPELQIARPKAAEVAPVVKRVKTERDEEDLELYAEFLEEADEGMDRCDEILLDVENGTNDPEYVNEMFRIYHSTKGVASCSELEDITTVSHWTEEVLSAVRGKKLEFKGHVVDIVFESTALMRELLDECRSSVEESLEFGHNLKCEPLVVRLKTVNRGEIPEAAKAPEPETQAAQAPVATKPKPKLKETVKVDMELLQALDGLLNKLASAQEQVTGDGAIKDAAAADSIEALTQIAQLTVDLQEVSVRLRMVTLKPVFQKMSRLVRDLAKKTEKLVKLVVEGDETKIDRKMVEKVGAPLVHMVRNAVDHGVEGAEARKESGKPLLGTIKLSAYHEGDNMIVEISDDGRGINREAILKKASSQGLIEESEGVDMLDADVFQLLFQPGFSTAAAVTDISGRGVGMDVVKKDIESMGGHVEISSQLGHGSSFRMVLPQISR